ncbi:MAG: enoyl-CoA hydratase/isomerase family protein [Halococcoides sp.]
MASDRIAVTADRIASITLDRPDRMNALTPSMLDALADAIDRLGDDESVRAITITGAGETFCAGADVTTLIRDADAGTAMALSRRGQDAFAALETCPTPVVAGIDGVALGGGMELAAAADLRIATPDATFGQPEIDLGVIPCWGGTQRLSHLVGEGRASEIVLTGDRYAAEEMAEYGFLTAVVEDLETALDTWAERIGRGPPLAQAAAKRALLAGRGETTAGLDVETEAFGRLVTTDDAREGVEAFLNDDDPQFEGR